jgi:pseudaminic acid cytidylyltransferase
VGGATFSKPFFFERTASHELGGLVVSHVWALIPARGGSSRIPRKNIQPFNNKPMIGWPVEALLASGKFSRVIVSTDDEEIADVARSFGAEVPFLRPSDLATGHAGTAPVIRHALEELKVPSADVVMCVYPTAALTTSIFEEGLDLAFSAADRFVISVGRHRSPQERALVQNQAGQMEIEHPEFLLTRTQDLETRFFDAGKFYAATAALWQSQETMMSKPFLPFFLPDWATVDIDEPADWPLAEALHKVFVSNGTS